jgi:hypothetical protein
MPSDREATERWLLDIHHHIAMVEGFVAGVPRPNHPPLQSPMGFPHYEPSL